MTGCNHNVRGLHLEESLVKRAVLRRTLHHKLILNLMIVSHQDQNWFLRDPRTSFQYHRQLVYLLRGVHQGQYLNNQSYMHRELNPLPAERVREPKGHQNQLLIYIHCKMEGYGSLSVQLQSDN